MRKAFVLGIVVLLAVAGFAIAGDKKPLKKPPKSSYEPPHAGAEDESADAFDASEETIREDRDEGPQFLDKEIILNVMKRRFPQIKNCYERVLKMDSKLKGSVFVEFKIQVDGSVTDVKIDKKKSSLKNKLVLNCIVNRIKDIKFPARRKGKPQTVRFPFKFKPKKVE